MKNTYIIIPQKPYLCNIACLNMVLYRREKRLFEQEELAQRFNIKIHPQYQQCFSVELEHTEKSNDDEGIKTIESTNIFNDFFLKENIALSSKAYKYSDIIDLELFIKKHLSDWNDLLVEYKTEWIFPQSKSIHDGLIESIEWRNITIINPDPLSKNRFTLHIDLLAEAMSDTFARETGIIVISKK